MMKSTILETSLAKLPVRRGKVRDIYDLGDRLLLVSTDRISAFDWVLPTGIPDKGRVLTQLSRFWFERLDVPNHMLSCNVDEIELPTGLRESDRLPGPIFTPATKAEQGKHDENISYDDVCARVGKDLAKRL